MDIYVEIENIIESTIKKREFYSWSLDEQIRYVYISLGKIINKSPDFFLSISGKLANDGLDVSEIKKIHEIDASHEVTCMVTCRMLKYIFDSLKIESKIMKTNLFDEYVKGEEEYKFYHYFIMCYGSNDLKYFLSLNADLMNIKLGLPPRHFAADIPFINNEGKKIYCEIDCNVDEFNGYDTVVLDLEYMKNMDMRIGYLQYYGNDIFDYSKSICKRTFKEIDDLYYASLAGMDNYNISIYEDVNFYKSISDIFKEFGTDNYSKLGQFEIIKLKLLIHNLVMKIIKTKTKSNIYDDINKELENFVINDKLDEYKNIIVERLKTLDLNVVINNNYKNWNLFALISDEIRLFNSIDNLKNICDELEISKYPYHIKQKIKENSKYYKINFKNLNKHFIKSSLFPSNRISEYYLDNDYLYTKLKAFFIRDFGCVPDSSTNLINDFNKSDIIEQAEYIKIYLKSTFKKELVDDKFYDRIMVSIAKSKSGEYCIFICINSNKPSEKTYSMVYYPKKNILIDGINMLDLTFEYEILSTTVNDKLSRIENIEKNTKPKLLEKNYS